MPRPIVFDITHLRYRAPFRAPTGIDRVDLAFGRHFASAQNLQASVQYAWNYPSVGEPSRLDDIVRKLEARWRERSPLEQDLKFQETREWIVGIRPTGSRRVPRGRGRPVDQIFNDAKLFLERAYPSDAKRRPVPKDAIYLNIAQHAVQHEVFFRWLAVRDDVRAVFFLHDLIPLDFPEYWPASHKDLFARRINTILRYASALIVSSAAVRDRVLAELDARKIAKVPIHCAHLPSPTEIVLPNSNSDDELGAQPYFVVLGTIEPRKNHALLLNIWRSLASRGGRIPKLVVIGGRGWQNENVIAMLDRCPSLADHVREVSGLSNAGVSKLLANAIALLQPSFAEGYGLPLVESLNVGTPVVASDIPVFREVTQGRAAAYLDPIDGAGWSETVVALCDRQSQLRRAAKEQASMFRPMTSKAYFDELNDFLLSV